MARVKLLKPDTPPNVQLELTMMEAAIVRAALARVYFGDTAGTYPIFQEMNAIDYGDHQEHFQKAYQYSYNTLEFSPKNGAS